MDKKIEIFNDFFKILPSLEKCIENSAVRSGISSKAALYLLALNNSDFMEYIPELINELKNKGLIDYEENTLKPTSKGMILAKSFNNLLEKY